MTDRQSLGVVIGRFQIHELHAGHKHLIDYAIARHDQVLILIGHNDIRFTTRDPLPYELRRMAVAAAYPEVLIAPLPDSKISNAHWSTTVDALISAYSATGAGVLYGSRDSFIPGYEGCFPTEEVPQLLEVSATTVREQAIEMHVDDPVFRLGWLAAIGAQYAVTDPTVDVAIVSPDWRYVLMGRRGAGAPLRFFGGFVDSTDQSLEAAALREQMEEAVGISVGDPRYLGSVRINDERYRKTAYGIMTTFFALEYQGGEATAGDDMGEVEWVALAPQTKSDVTPTHQALFDLLLREQRGMLAA